jgi:hypothetical protein
MEKKPSGLLEGLHLRMIFGPKQEEKNRTNY